MLISISVYACSFYCSVLYYTVYCTKVPVQYCTSHMHYFCDSLSSYPYSVGHDHELINYIDTKAKCRHL